MRRIISDLSTWLRSRRGSFRSSCGPETPGIRSKRRSRPPVRSARRSQSHSTRGSGPTRSLRASTQAASFRSSTT
jgi:hypothetical protein